MEENVVLQVSFHEDGGLEIRLGNTKVSNYTLIGILEQVKINILTEESPDMEKLSLPGNNKYDA